MGLEDGRYEQHWFGRVLCNVQLHFRHARRTARWTKTTDYIKSICYSHGSKLIVTLIVVMIMVIMRRRRRTMMMMTMIMITMIRATDLSREE